MTDNPGTIDDVLACVELHLGCLMLSRCTGTVGWWEKRGTCMDAFLYIIWINKMITTSTNSKQDNIFDCCQGLQFDLCLILCRSPWGITRSEPNTKRWYRKPLNSLHSDIKTSSWPHHEHKIKWQRQPMLASETCYWRGHRLYGGCAFSSKHNIKTQM